MKKIKLTTNGIINLYNTITNIANEKISFKSAVKIATNIQKLKIINEQFENKRVELINKYGEKDEKGKVIVSDNGTIKIKNVKAFNSSLSEILCEEFEVELEKLSEEDLEGIKISANDIYNIREILDK